MKNIKYIIVGIASAILLLPIINTLQELIILWIEVLKVKPNIKILNGNKDATLLREFIKPTYPAYDRYDDEYEDFDEDNDE